MPRAKRKGGKKLKLKTKHSCRKRFKITKTGKVIIKKTNKRHHLECKGKKNIRHNRKPGTLFEGVAKKVKRCYLYVTVKRKKIK
jgi:large subunit ribosomal protein L35